MVNVKVRTSVLRSGFTNTYRRQTKEAIQEVADACMKDGSDREMLMELNELV
jgi:hypothetical protein